MTNHAENYAAYIEGRHYTGPCLVDPELDDWVLVTNLGESYAVLNGRIECNPKKGLIRRASDQVIYSIYTANGYAKVTPSFPGESGSPVSVHIIVCAVVYGYKPQGLNEVNHKDFDKMNSSASNLEWCDRIYNTWYNKLKPQTYYIYTTDTLKKIKELPNYLSVLHYFNIKNFKVVTIGSIKKYSRGGASTSIATIRGAFITKYDYGDVIDLPLPTKKCIRHAVSAYDKNSGITNVFSTVRACAIWLCISESCLYDILKSNKYRNRMQKLSQYIISSLSWEEYYSFYDKQFNDPTIHLDISSFSNRANYRCMLSNAMSDEEQKQAYISKQLQKIGGIIDIIQDSTMNQENSNKLNTCINKLRRIAYKNKPITQEDIQCPTAQLTLLSLCA